MRRPPLLRLSMTVAVAAAMTAVGLLAAPGTSTAVQTTAKGKPIYISMGDSYSVGYQNATLGNTKGFTGYVAGKEHDQLENFGCGGATTTSLFTQVGCPPGGSAASDAVAYPTTNQVAAVLYYINGATNRGRVKLITVSIGGNDVTACATQVNPVGCVVTAASTIQTNVTSLVTQLDAALTANGDSGAHIVGITYPDVILGDYVAPVGATNQSLAYLSTVVFDAIINPTLATAYSSANTLSFARGGFVNVTRAPYGLATAGDDTGSFNATTYAYTGPTEKLKGFGTAVPAPVAEVCTITWYCDPATFGDIHATTKGYDFIGRLIVAELATL